MARSGALRLGLALLALVAVGALLQKGSQVLARAGLVPVPQHYVALSLPHPDDLPAHLGSGRRLVFSFDVANYMGSEVDQLWQVSAVTAVSPHRVGPDGVSPDGVSPDGVSTVRLLRQGTVAVPAGATRGVNLSMNIPPGISPVEIEVSLPGRHLAPVSFHLSTVPAAGNTRKLASRPDRPASKQR